MIKSEKENREVPKKVGRWITIKINSFQNYHLKMMIDKLNSLLPLNLIFDVF
ncbi:hypothetical protein [Spiroplasma endosymbiont of Dasysyrphus albostriatus]|uniref:hypothetical protein n=1 Tax=Spiroplasma endosymbiont of Dasysyrphus albostriatus TaxID=3066299 RepID=UPI0030CE1640